ncbi:hypothetical protein Q4E93_34360 [Flavitalea sp. BT771]|uniref:hypothetical protein n=1 Tax=Flavitalea sp. BT771 TaxID=3063329 RepID=UPI0026E3E8BE|nr:hypothetical protein [Flavitalea sp. BT771]MDO6435749.1 hypothetical protein [Flavitalea sp. BT771]MDV6224650.1 hypothetical protein [Flavitalea sp. BT771]
MTLCLAWGRNGEISLASDSRLTDPQGNVSTDIATKIFTIGVKIFASNRRQVLFNHSYGMCFAGSYVNGSIVADTMSELLSSLVFTDNGPVDADTIAQIAYGIYQDVCKHLMEINRHRGLSDIWLAGHCPQTGRNRLFKFSWELNEQKDGIHFHYVEEDIGNQLLFLGDQVAIARAMELSQQIKFERGIFTSGYTEYHLLQNIIEDNKIPTVGGSMQTGHILGNSFKQFGMVDYELWDIPNTNAKWVRDVATFRGIPLARGIESVNAIRVDTSMICMAPFTEKKAALEQKALALNQQK